MEDCNLKVSIIVPIYNVEGYLEQCITSILRQTYTNLEILLIDDGSKDNSRSIIEQYAKLDHRIIPLFKENRGAASARKYGIEHATGDYITFVDGDDYIRLDAIELLINIAFKNRFDIICGTISYYYPKLNNKVINIYPPYIGMVPDNSVYLARLLRMEFQWTLVGKIFRIELFENLVHPDFRVGQDGILMLQLVEKAQSIYYIHNSLYIYVQRNSSTSYNYTKNYIIDSFRFGNFIYRRYEGTNNIDIKDAVEIMRIRNFISVIHKGGYLYFMNEFNEYVSLFDKWGIMLKSWERLLFKSYKKSKLLGDVINGLIKNMRYFYIRYAK